MTTRLFIFIPLLIVSLQPLQSPADDEVRAVQEELRRRKLYFGDVDGRETSEVDEAVKRYQKRKGLNTVGVRDPETLRSLGLAGRGDAPPKDLEWPEGTILKSDLTINVVEAAEELSQETGVTLASIVGEKLAGADPSSGRRGINRVQGQLCEEPPVGAELLHLVARAAEGATPPSHRKICESSFTSSWRRPPGRTCATSCASTRIGSPIITMERSTGGSLSAGCSAIMSSGLRAGIAWARRSITPSTRSARR